MKKVLFIVLPDYQIETQLSDIDWRPPFLGIPYGVLSIAAYIREYTTKSVDFQVLNLNEIVYEEALATEINHDRLFDRIQKTVFETTLKFQPDFIFCSTLFNAAFVYIETIVKGIEQSGSNAITVIGGHVATNHYNLFLETFSRIDAVSFSEGEVSLLELVDSDTPLETLEANIAMVTRKKLANDFTPKARYVENLDDIPVFAFDLVDMEKYLGKYYENQRLAASKYSDKPVLQDRGIFVISTRGCPYDCVFCCSHSVHGKKIRYKSADSVVREIIYLKETYDLVTISIQDDNFFQNKERAIDILDQLIELDLGLRYEFSNGIIVYRADEDVISRLKKLGVQGMNLPIESGSDRVLKEIIKKPLDLKTVKRVVELFKKYDMRAYTNFIFGFPGETEEDRQESLKLIEDSEFDWVNFLVAIPFSGSRLYDICHQSGYIKNKEQVLLGARKYSAGIIDTPDFTSEYISEYVYFNNLKYNFVKNANYKNGHYEIASSFFLGIANTYKNHAIALYMIYRCYQNMPTKTQEAKDYYSKFSKVVQEDLFWRDYAIRFGFCDQDGNAFPEPDSSVSF